MLRIILCPSATWANGMKTTSLASSGGKKVEKKIDQRSSSFTKIRRYGSTIKNKTPLTSLFLRGKKYREGTARCRKSKQLVVGSN